MAVMFSLPAYVPDTTSWQMVTGYRVQSIPASSAGTAIWTGSWTDITGSPFASPANIVDVNGTRETLYRVQPQISPLTSQGGSILQNGGVNVVLDVPWSPIFKSETALYDQFFTKWLLPTLRFTYMGDQGTRQSNGTKVTENIGAGQGLWMPDGNITRFGLNVVTDDDPIIVLDGAYQLNWTDNSNALKSSVPDQDYHVDLKAGIIEFATAPAATDYLRFDFYRSTFVNEWLLQGLRSAVSALSQFGLFGYGTQKENNLWKLSFTPNDAMAEIICKLAIWLMRQGSTEEALRSSMSWRDGNDSVDPFPSRGLQFLVQDLQITEASIQQRVNAYIKRSTVPFSRGDVDIVFDFNQHAPLSPSLISNLVAYSGIGVYGAYSYAQFFPWYTFAPCGRNVAWNLAICWKLRVSVSTLTR